MAHAVGIAAFGLLVGDSLSHAVVEGSVVALFALAAGWGRGGRTARAVLVSVGLLSASAILVHLSGGTIEMHFHFFVMLGVIALYQDWLTYLVAVGFVALHHGTVRVIDAHGVYNHPAAQANPWTWLHQGGLAPRRSEPRSGRRALRR